MILFIFFFYVLNKQINKFILHINKKERNVSTTPTLHVWGKKDTLVPPQRSEELAKLFLGATTFEHSGGHVLPNNAEAKNTYLSFLDAVLAAS